VSERQFSFDIIAEDPVTHARAGVFHTPHGDVPTPIFMPVGTKATVKGILPDQLKAIGTRILLANTYHLSQRPGADLIEDMGGLHTFMRWDGPILTDSGGFQIFSHGEFVRLADEGVTFRTVDYDGSYVHWSPADNMRIAQQLGADIVSKEVVGISFDGKFKVLTADEEFSADALIIATGTSRKVPRIKGIADFEGLGVSYCAVCDGFFHRGKDVAVLGSGKYALHEAQALLPIAGSVTVLTDGASPEVEFPSEIKVDERKISHLDGSPMALSTVVFDDSSSMTISGLFIAQGSASSTDLARKVGIATDSNKIVVDENMATNIPGIFACGDCTGGLLQVSKAVYDGATAGNSVVKYLRELTKK